MSLLVTVETELACSLSSILSGIDSLEIGSSVEAILSEESFFSVETGLVKKLSIVFHSQIYQVCQFGMNCINRH
jgi:hypothetical protein